MLQDAGRTAVLRYDTRVEESCHTTITPRALTAEHHMAPTLRISIPLVAKVIRLQWTRLAEKTVTHEPLGVATSCDSVYSSPIFLFHHIQMPLPA